MRNEGQKAGRANGAYRAFSSCLRIVSSGASTVASSVRSAASAIVDRDNDSSNDQVLWAGFDKLESYGGNPRQVLLLACRSGFQVWDVEEADNVRNLVSRHDGSVSFMQVLPRPITSKKDGDKFAEDRPLLAVCADVSLSGGGNNALGPVLIPNRTTSNSNLPSNGGFMPSVVWFYSLRSQSYLHVLKFRSAIYSVRCSTRVVAIAQAAQIHCLNAATLEKEYTILTNPIDPGCSAFGGIGYGPLAVGTRWLAYSGTPVAVSNSGRVNPQHMTASTNFPASASNGSLVAHYAKESSKQLAAGIVTLGDMGYKKLSSYYSEPASDGHNSSQKGNLGWKPNGTTNGHLPDIENVGMVIVRDIVSKSPIAQFRAHASPISSLCFDPSGTLLVTASVQGHNIHVFRIMPGKALNSSVSDSGPSYIHLYKLQRGITNAVIQDISFSDDSHWITISSSRGTSHLFAISPFGGPVDFLGLDGGPNGMSKPVICWPPSSNLQKLKKQNLYEMGPPLTLSVVDRIRSGSSGWRSTVSGAAAAATGKANSFSGAIASVFHNCRANVLDDGDVSLKPKHHILVFSSGSMVQHVMRASIGQELATVISGHGTYRSAADSDVGVLVEAVQKWDIFRKNMRREREDTSDIYGDSGNSERSKVFPEEIEDNGGCLKGPGSFGKEKISPEEKHHMFISEAELKMYVAQIPLWGKRQNYFQFMTYDGGKLDEECGHGGDIEIERVPTRMIEAKSKHLVPVYESLQTPNSQPPRISDLDNTTNRRLVRPTSENGSLSRRGSASSLGLMADGGFPITELHSDIEDITTGCDGPRMPMDTMKGSVNSSNHNPKPNIQGDFVNYREIPAAEADIKLVNNKVESHNMENQVEDDGISLD